MRVRPFLAVFVGVTVAGCDDAVAPAESGTLEVSTATSGDDPDADGYLLVIGADTLALAPSGTFELDLGAGAYTLRLLGVAEHCTLASGSSIKVSVRPGRTTPVAFAVECPATGVRLTTNTAGVDLDPNGYRVTVDGGDRGPVPATGTSLIRLGPGERAIALTGMAPNCAIVGPGAWSVVVVERQVVPLEFAATCTATSGVVGVSIVGQGDLTGNYLAMVDGAMYPVGAGGPWYISHVPPGDHVVELLPPGNCTVTSAPQPISLAAGGVVRDTVEVSFTVACAAPLGLVQISVSTSGPPPSQDYSVWACEYDFYCRFYGSRLGSVAPNGVLPAQLPPGLYLFWLEDLPPGCAAGEFGPVSVSRGQTIGVQLGVTCP